MKSSPPIAVGRVALTVNAAAGVTRRARVHEQGSLRVRFPGPASDALEAVLLNTAGGMAGGDRFDVEVEAREGAFLVLGTAAAEKVYRTLGPVTRWTSVSTSAPVPARVALRETILPDGVARAGSRSISLRRRLVVPRPWALGRAGREKLRAELQPDAGGASAGKPVMQRT
jgi:urease accessory protein